MVGMRLQIILVLLLGSSVLPAAEPPAVTAFINVNVVPMDRERVLSNQTVLIRDNRIEAMGPADRIEVPESASRVQGNGQSWLVPGLADMHTHLSTSEDAALYVAGGVTTVLQMGGEGRIEPVLVLRNALKNALAPQVFFGFMLDGSEPLSGGWPIHSVAQARLAVQVAKDRHYDFIKLYNGLTPEQFDAIVDEGNKQGLPVIGHAVRSVGLPASLFRGQVMVAHAEEFYYTAFGNKPDESLVAALVADTKRSGAYVTANLSFLDAIDRQWGKPAVRAQFFADPLVKYMSTVTRVLAWESPRRNYAARSGSYPMPMSFMRKFVAELARAGVPILAGTDSPLIPGLVPGAGINEELRMLVESGLSNFHALSTATRVPGEFIARYAPGGARFGVVEAGARADLLLLQGNPLERLDTLRSPLGVMQNGNWWPAVRITEVLEQNRRAMDGSIEEAFRNTR
jgi:imidazolonepropionase-like amidohydrolase